jgi:diguanylate cyclase (GGDEF)-like protein
LRLIATVDVLTGLYTRRHILELGGREEERWRRHGGHLSLALIDIDHFKKVNDTYGHASGDEVLKRFAEVCRETFRQIDFIGRFGGEEFLVVLPDTGMDDACAIAERLRLHTESENIVLQKAGIRITASIGVSEMTPADASLEQAVSRADAALYRAKNNGRNRVERASAEGG